MEAILQWVVPPVFGLIGGTIASFSAPWAQWGVEKRRNRDAERRKLIHEVRELLAEDPMNQRQFRKSVIYSRLRPHLSQKLVGLIEGEAIVIQRTGRGSDTWFYVPDVLDRLVELERKWKLV